MFYGIRVNSALATLSIAPNLIEKNFRRSMQQVGEASGNTPQEVALFIAAELPLIHRVNLPHAVVEKWVIGGKVNNGKPEMRDALTKLSFFELAYYSKAP